HMHAHVFIDAERREHEIKRWHDDDAAANAEETADEAGDQSRAGKAGGKPHQFAPHGVHHAAMLCARVTCARAARTTSTPAPDFTPCSERTRRQARPPGRALNSPSMWRVMAWSGAPSASLRSI